MIAISSDYVHDDTWTLGRPHTFTRASRWKARSCWSLPRVSSSIILDCQWNFGGLQTEWGLRWPYANFRKHAFPHFDLTAMAEAQCYIDVKVCPCKPMLSFLSAIVSYLLRAVLHMNLSHLGPWEKLTFRALANTRWHHEVARGPRYLSFRNLERSYRCSTIN